MKKLLEVNNEMYLIDKEVVILKIFHVFHLAEVKYIDSSQTFMIDYNALSVDADMSNVISLRLLDGVSK